MRNTLNLKKPTNKHAIKKLQKQNHFCFLCDQTLDDYEITKDHLIPKSLGSSKHWDNVVLTHRRCNSNKGNRMPTMVEIRKYASIFGAFPKGWASFKEQIGE